MPIHRAVTFGADAAAAVMYAALLERACRTELLAAAGGPRLWSDENETHFKREQVWNRPQLEAGWQYLLRKAGVANAEASGGMPNGAQVC
jgi:ribulose-5-phosphate 4-epimerase/fuculose-1-phosphate aldolase